MPNVKPEVYIPPATVLEGAKLADLTDVFIVGRRKSGQLFSASSSGDRNAIEEMIEEWEKDIGERLEGSV